MKIIPLFFGLLLLPGSALAQVVVNHAALDQLAGIAPPPVMAPVAPPATPVGHRLRRVAVFKPVLHPLAPAAPVVAVPVVAVPVVAVPVVAVPVVARPAPVVVVKPMLPPVAQIAFGRDGADLPAGAAATLQPFCHYAGIVSIAALAPGDAGDPSAAMRLSMRRAFAVRDALVACGLADNRILPLALGDAPGQNPDVTKVTAGK